MRGNTTTKMSSLCFSEHGIASETRDIKRSLADVVPIKAENPNYHFENSCSKNDRPYLLFANTGQTRRRDLTDEADKEKTLAYEQRYHTDRHTGRLKDTEEKEGGDIIAERGGAYILTRSPSLSV